MLNSVVKIIILLFVSSFFFSVENESHTRLYVTSDVKGETEPCGWKKKPAGGLARKCTIVQNSRDAGFNTLVLDAGNLFFKQDKIDPGISLDAAKENAQTIVSAFNHISCQAFSPGKKDFSAGLDFLLELNKKSNFDYISCNIKGKDARLLFDSYKIIDLEDIKLGIIGASSSFESKDVLIEDPQVSIARVLSEIRDQCDYVILLFSASAADYKKIANSDLELDLVIRGNTNKKSNDGGKNSFPIYSVGDRGKTIYQFDLKHTTKQAPLIDIAYLERTIRNDSKRLNQLMLDTIQSNIQKESKVSQYRQNIQNYSQILNSVQNSLQFKQITLDKFVQDDPYVLRMVDEGKLKMQSIGIPIIDPHRFHNH